MARPTLSKIVYVQQLGRGTRKAPGKEHLLVFDFVDESTRYARALSLHRLFKKTDYRPGALVAAPDEQLLQEQQTIAAGEIPRVILGIGIYDTALRPIDVFRWQDEAEGMITTNELAIELRVDDSTIRDRIRRGEVSPDLAVPVGDREYYFFRHDRVAELQHQYGVTPLRDDNVRDSGITVATRWWSANPAEGGLADSPRARLPVPRPACAGWRPPGSGCLRSRASTSCGGSCRCEN
jgi:hypothetical protein